MLIRRPTVLEVVVILSVCLTVVYMLTSRPHGTVCVYRITSMRQLRDIGMATHGWSIETAGNLVVQESPSISGRPVQSWSTRLLPYLDQNALDEVIDHEQAWDSPANREWFQCEVERFQNPELGSSSDTKNAAGYALTHYSANQHVAESQSVSCLDDIARADGMSNTLMYGEAAGHFKPWGQPGNWRDPSVGLNKSPDGFGGSDDGVGFVFWDGHVQMLNPDIDPSVLRAISTPDGGESVFLNDFKD